MAGLINRRGLGAQPQPVSAQRRGGGGQRRITGRGGGGRGGGGRNHIPNIGLYHGRAGEAAANRNPEAFFRAGVSQVGGLGYSGTPIDQFSQEFIASLLDDYNSALSGNQRLSPLDWFKDQFNARWGGKKGRTFDPGTLGLSGGALGDAYTDWYSNTNPIDYLTGQATEQGGFLPGGGNQDYQNWFLTNYAPGVQAELAGARANDPTLSMADLIEGRDLVGQARARYLARPNARRQLGPVNLGSRWSWWD